MGFEHEKVFAEMQADKERELLSYSRLDRAMLTYYQAACRSPLLFAKLEENLIGLRISTGDFETFGKEWPKGERPILVHLTTPANLGRAVEICTQLFGLTFKPMPSGGRNDAFAAIFAEDAFFEVTSNTEVGYI